MHACRIAIATALLSMAVATPFAAKSASLRVGITIVEACNIRTTAFDPERARDPVQADCSADTPYSVALGGRSMRDDGRSRPATVPEGGGILVSADHGVRIATFTF